MAYLGRLALLVAVGISALELVVQGEEALPLFVIALLVTGLALSLSGDRSKP